MLKETNPALAYDVRWILERNLKRPISHVTSIADINILHHNEVIDTKIEDGKGLTCGCNVGSSCSIF